jgi:hypothetical protein
VRLPAALFSAGLELADLGTLAGRSHADAGRAAVERVVAQLAAAGAPDVLGMAAEPGAPISLHIGFTNGFEPKPRSKFLEKKGIAPNLPQTFLGRSGFEPKPRAKCLGAQGNPPSVSGPSCLVSEREESKRQETRQEGVEGVALATVGDLARPVGVAQGVGVVELAAVRGRFADWGVELADTRTLRVLLGGLPWPEVERAVDYVNAARVDGHARDLAAYFVGVLRERRDELCGLRPPRARAPRAGAARREARR